VETEYYAKLNTTNRQFLRAAIVVTFILAAGGAFGLVNVMTASVAQREKEFGVLRALGFTRRQILVSIQLEAVLIAAAGGLAGCLVAVCADGWTVTSILGSGQGTGKSVVLRLAVDRSVLAAGLGFALIVGWVAGLVPALGAARIRPADALR
jgi:putative ABC transport system permease protein